MSIATVNSCFFAQTFVSFQAVLSAFGAAENRQATSSTAEDKAAEYWNQALRALAQK